MISLAYCKKLPVVKVVHINLVIIWWQKLTGKPLCTGLCYHSQYVKFPLNRSVWFFWHWSKNRRPPAVASTLSAEMHTVIVACPRKISCEDTIATEELNLHRQDCSRSKLNLHSGILIHNTVHKNYAIEYCKFSFMYLLIWIPQHATTTSWMQCILWSVAIYVSNWRSSPVA